LNAAPEADKIVDVSKNAKMWLTFAGSLGLYLIWKFVFNLWPLGQ
jgi:hypothetical protein